MYNANYMDGVPVKIAEKYKPPPPKYNLSQPLANKLNLDDNFFWNSPLFSCDLHLEKKALSKIDEWKRIRQRNKEQRKERISKREEQRRRDDEVKQKNLLYCVSYPSTDDFSSEEEKVELDTLQGSEVSGTQDGAFQMCDIKKINSFQNILQPTVLALSNSSTPSDALTPAKKTSFDSKISNSFNYKDFEEDTSSPFDNVELKTINDLDVLAQVLHNTQIQFKTDEKLTKNFSVVSCDEHTSKSSSAEQELKEEYQGNSLLTLSENIPKANNSLPRFNNDFNWPQEESTVFKNNHLISEITTQNIDNIPPYILSPVNQHNEVNNLKGCYASQSNQNTNKNLSVVQLCGRQHVLLDDKITKSRSVPDILKELSDEIRKSEIRRHKNCSYNMEDAVESDGCLLNQCGADSHNLANKTIFDILDDKEKQLVEQISAMGFPFKRVARIVQLVGTDDKKVVEHLIPLSELMDLGFEEGKISEALIRNENNKNKALDDLIT